MTPAGFRFPISTRTLLSPDPTNEATRRALNALRAGRIADVLGFLNQLPKETFLEQAWTIYIEARILLEQGDFVRAKAVAQRAASTALGPGLADPPSPSILRLAAAALEMQGTALRRQDHPTEAGRIHRTAFELRREHGTPDEQSESALSLGSCKEWSGDWAAAERWYRDALNLDVAKPEQAEQKSLALTRLSALLTKLARHDEAIDAAKSAQELLNEFMPGDVATISAGLHTAQAMVRYAEKLLIENPDQALLRLDEAAEILRNAHEDLSAFGPEIDVDMAWCNEQLDFVDRLRQMISPEV